MSRAIWLAQFVLIFQVALCAPLLAQNDANEPVQSPHGPLNLSCDKCHVPNAWMLVRKKPEFDHNKTGFPLRGMHVGIACEECHVNRIFSKVGTRCQDCHVDAHLGDVHRDKNDQECALCHRETGWYVSSHMINWHTDRFPLIGAHAAADCYSCHRAGAVGKFNRQGLSTVCDSCHMQAYNQAKAPNHRASGFSTDCQQCHRSFDTWLGAMAAGMPMRR